MEAVETRIISEHARAVWGEVDAADDGIETQDERIHGHQAECTPAAVERVVAGTMRHYSNAESLREAVRWAIAEEHGRAWYAMLEVEEDERFAEWQELDAAKERLVRAVIEALPRADRPSYSAQSISMYLWYQDVKIRVSNHRQVAGGGFNEGKQERAGEADLEFVAVIDEPLPSRQEIRSRVAAVLLARREDGR